MRYLVLLVTLGACAAPSPEDCIDAHQRHYVLTITESCRTAEVGTSGDYLLPTDLIDGQWQGCDAVTVTHDAVRAGSITHTWDEAGLLTVSRDFPGCPVRLVEH